MSLFTFHHVVPNLYDFLWNTKRDANQNGSLVTIHFYCIFVSYYNSEWWQDFCQTPHCVLQTVAIRVVQVEQITELPFWGRWGHIVASSTSYQSLGTKDQLVVLSYTQSWSELLAPLGNINMIKEGCENESALLILLIFYLNKSQKSNLSLDNNNLKWKEISLWNNFFSLIHISHN